MVVHTKVSLDLDALHFFLADAFKIPEPRLREESPDLKFWSNLSALANGSDADDVDLRCFRLNGNGVNQGATNLTEGLLIRIAPLRGLDVGRELAREQGKTTEGIKNHHTKGCAGESLAITAMADHYPVGVDYRFIVDLAAMADSVNVNDVSDLQLSHLLWQQ